MESKLVVIGAGGVGKSAVTVKYVQGNFVTDYDPSIYNKYRKQDTVDGKVAIVEIVDTAGQEEYRAMRAPFYVKGEGFVVIYSVTDRGSFAEVERLRDEVLDERGGDFVPMVLVGNKCDLTSQRKVTRAEGEALARCWFGENKPVPFIETSAKDATNISGCFHEVVRQLRRQRAGELLFQTPTLTPPQPPIESVIHEAPRKRVCVML